LCLLSISHPWKLIWGWDESKILEEYYENYPKTGKKDCNKARFVIADDNGKIIDDAQGYGYKTKQNACKALWYKFKGGKEKIEEKKRERREFFKNNLGVEKWLRRTMWNNWKEIALGTVTDEDIIKAAKEKFDINVPKEYLDHVGEE